MADNNLPFTLQIIITEQCNLRCKYCFEVDKGPRDMSTQLAKELIDRELSQPTNFKEYQIELAGGEPFLRFKDLKEIVEFGISNAKRWNKRMYFFICSNLTLVNGEIKDWLKNKRKWVILGTSLDGTKEAHDFCRNNSYDAVIENIPFYKRMYPNQGVKMTIGPDSIDSIYDGIRNIESMDLSVSANVVYEPVWGDSKSKNKHLEYFTEQLDLLVQHYADNPDLKVPNLLSLPIRALITYNDSNEHRWCGSGKTMRAYDTDGRMLPCHRFSRFSTNKIYKGPQSIERRVKVACDDCSFIDACPTCAGYNWEVYGYPESRTNYHCEFIKLQLLATAKLEHFKNSALISQINKGPNKNIKDIPFETLQTLKAVEFVMKNLNIDKLSPLNLEAAL